MIKRVIIVELIDVQDSSGKRDYFVKNASALALEVDIVGLKTAMLGQSQGFTLTSSVLIDKSMYKDQKYLFFENALHEVKTFGRAKKTAQMYLNCQECAQSKIVAAVRRWIDANI